MSSVVGCVCWLWKGLRLWRGGGLRGGRRFVRPRLLLLLRHCVAAGQGARAPGGGECVCVCLCGSGRLSVFCRGPCVSPLFVRDRHARHAVRQLLLRPQSMNRTGTVSKWTRASRHGERAGLTAPYLGSARGTAPPPRPGRGLRCRPTKGLGSRVAVRGRVGRENHSLWQPADEWSSKGAVDSWTAPAAVHPTQPADGGRRAAVGIVWRLGFRRARCVSSIGRRSRPEAQTAAAAVRQDDRRRPAEQPPRPVAHDPRPRDWALALLGGLDALRHQPERRRLACVPPSLQRAGDRGAVGEPRLPGAALRAQPLL